MIEYLSDPVFMKIYFIVILILLFYIFIRYICYGEQSSNIFSNNLIKYISSNEEKAQNYANSKKQKNENEEHAPLTNHINIDFMGESECKNSANNQNQNNSFASLSIAEQQEKEAKIMRFAIDYCRASPNIHLKNKSLLNIGWRSTKFHFEVDLELANSFNYINENENSIMTAIPINKALIDFEDVMLKEGFANLIQSFNHKNILKNLHLDVLKNQNLMVKIQKFYDSGSLRDVLYKTNPKKTYAQKYPNNTRGKPLHASLISLYGKQILAALHYLHSNKWYHLHLHSGNVLVDEKTQGIKITELENFVCDLPLKNEQYYYFIYEEFNFEKNPNSSNSNNLKEYQNNNSNNNNNIFSDIFKSQFNIFEKIDIISFGRILYEMTTGKELKSPFPDELEYKDMDIEIAVILKTIFHRKNNKFQLNNYNNYNNNAKASSENTAADLLNFKFFDPENNNINNKSLVNLTNGKKGKNKNLDFKNNNNNEELDESRNDEVSKLNIDIEPNDANKSEFMNSSEQYCSGIKEKIFNQNSFLMQKNKLINKFI